MFADGLSTWRTFMPTVDLTKYLHPDRRLRHPSPAGHKCDSLDSAKRLNLKYYQLAMLLKGTLPI